MLPLVSVGGYDHLSTGDHRRLPKVGLWYRIDITSWNRQKHTRYCNKPRKFGYNFLKAASPQYGKAVFTKPSIGGLATVHCMQAFVPVQQY